MPVAPPGITYPMTLPGYTTPGLIQRPSSPVKHISQTAVYPTIKTHPTTPVHIQPNSSTPSIIPNREWLLDTLKQYVLTHRGILICDYAKYKINKKDCFDKFHKLIAELYSSDKYNITSDWLSSACANPEFLPEYAAKLDC